MIFRYCAYRSVFTFALQRYKFILNCAKEKIRFLKNVLFYIWEFLAYPLLVQYPCNTLAIPLPLRRDNEGIAAAEDVNSYRIVVLRFLWINQPRYSKSHIGVICRVLAVDRCVYI